MSACAIDCPGCGKHLDDVCCECAGVGCIHEIAACFSAYIGHVCAKK